MSITLHPKFGVNPSVGVCFWCGEDDGTVLLLGMNKGKEAKRRTCAGYEPCDECKAKMATGVTLVEVTTYSSQEGQRELVDGAYPTGRWVVVTEAAMQRVQPPELASTILQKRKALVRAEDWKALGLPTSEQ